MSFAVTVGAPGAVVSVVSGWLGVFALALPSSVDSFPDLSFAFAVTSVLSATLFAGILISPVFSSIVISGSVPSGSFHLLSFPFVAITVTGSVVPSGVYVTLTSFVSSSVGGVTVTSPLSFAVTVGAPGAVVSCVTKLTAGIVSIDPSGYLIVALPVLSISTSVPVGKLVVLASSIAFLTASFSSCVNSFGFDTSVLLGIIGCVLSAIVFLVILGSDDVLLFSSVADADNIVFGSILSEGIVILPSSTFTFSSVVVQLSPSFVKVTVTGFVSPFGV